MNKEQIEKIDSFVYTMAKIAYENQDEENFFEDLNDNGIEKDMWLNSMHEVMIFVLGNLDYLIDIFDKKD
jgi:hypothetical protein